MITCNDRTCDGTALFPSFYEREREKREGVRKRGREKERKGGERGREGREVDAFSRLIARDKKLIRRLFKILPSLEGG